MSEELNDWETSSGLPLDNVIADIVEASFGPRNEITPGAIFLNLTFQPYDAETGEPGEQREQSYSVGKADLWDVGERGNTLVRVKSGSYKTSDNSTLGRLMNAVKHCAGMLEAMRGSPYRADTWVGIRAFWQVHEFENTLSKSGFSKPVLPTEFHGYVDVDEEVTEEEVPEPQTVNTPAPPAKKAAAPASKAAVKAPTKAAGGATKVPAKKAANKPQLDAELVAELMNLAQQYTDHDEFAAAAFDIEAVSESADAQTVVMNAGAGSLWANAQAALGEAEEVSA